MKPDAKEKPPVGLRPRAFHEGNENSLLKERGLEIIEAMSRYISAGKPIPEEWIDELRDRFQGS